eukprot:768693-Hanusia_phi.AAC.4
MRRRGARDLGGARQRERRGRDEEERERGAKEAAGHRRRGSSEGAVCRRRVNEEVVDAAVGRSDVSKVQLGLEIARCCHEQVHHDDPLHGERACQAQSSHLPAGEPQSSAGDERTEDSREVPEGGRAGRVGRSGVRDAEHNHRREDSNPVYRWRIPACRVRDQLWSDRSGSKSGVPVAVPGGEGDSLSSSLLSRGRQAAPEQGARGSAGAAGAAQDQRQRYDVDDRGLRWEEEADLRCADGELGEGGRERLEGLGAAGAEAVEAGAGGCRFAAS